MRKREYTTKAFKDVIWSGSSDSYPTEVELPSILPANLDRDNVFLVVTQYLQYAPLNAIPMLLQMLCCNSRRTKIKGLSDASRIDTQIFTILSKTNKKKICGKLFKNGDLIWNCRNCGKDDTCVQCDDCFQLSDHTNHDVYFHRASEGNGCCDCGDLEAWSDAGCCAKHKEENLIENYDPTGCIPDDIKRSVELVVAGIIQVILQHAVLSVRGFQSISHNVYLSRSSKEAFQDMDFVGRLFFDEVHDAELVTGALRSLGMSYPEARDWAKSVRKDGNTTSILIELG